MDGKAMESAEVRAERFFLGGYNCSQSVFCAFAEELGLSLDMAAKLSSGLGGGVGRMREVCGAVTGATLVLGYRHGPDKAAVYPKVQNFCARFKEACGSIICRELLEFAAVKAEVGGTPEARSETYYKGRPCVELVKVAARLLEE